MKGVEAMEIKDVLSLMIQFGTYTLVLVGTVVSIISFNKHKK